MVEGRREALKSEHYYESDNLPISPPVCFEIVPNRNEWRITEF